MCLPLACVLGAACQDRTALRYPSVVRLGSPAATVRLPLAQAQGRETRPAIGVSPGERKVWQVEAPQGSHLIFALALEREAAGAGLAFEWRLGGVPLFEGRLDPREARSFRRFRVPIESRGLQELEFVGHLRTGSGEGQPGRILLASARIDRPRPRQARRVLVWISQDTVRADHLGLYGYPRATSPAIAARAAKWVVFEDAMATAPWTLPSLVSQFTGRMPSDHGAVLDDRPRDSGLQTVFQVLSAQGFHVLGVTGNRFVSSDFRTADGFDALWFSPRGAAEVTRLALRAVREREHGDLALFVHYMQPHYPYEPPAPFDTLFDGQYRGSVNGRDFRLLRPGRARAADVAHVQALYDGDLAYTDTQIEVLLRGLEDLGMLEPAVIVYSADHGEGFLEHGKWLHTRTLYEELLHVPLAMRVPGRQPGRIARPVSLLDLAPTLLEALHIERPASFQGRSLMPLLEGRSLPARPLLAETEQTTGLATHKLALRDGRLKYIAIASRDERAVVLREELYDLSGDPGERSSLPLARAGRLPELARAFFARARSRALRHERVLLAPEDEQALRALGYVQ